MLTLLSIYILETVHYYRFKFHTVQGGDVHSYDMRARIIYRTAEYRTTAFKNLPP